MQEIKNKCLLNGWVESGEKRATSKYDKTKNMVEALLEGFMYYISFREKDCFLSFDGKYHDLWWRTDYMLVFYDQVENVEYIKGGFPLFCGKNIERNGNSYRAFGRDYQQRRSSDAPWVPPVIDEKWREIHERILEQCVAQKYNSVICTESMIDTLACYVLGHRVAGDYGLDRLIQATGYVWQETHWSYNPNLQRDCADDVFCRAMEDKPGAKLFLPADNAQPAIEIDEHSFRVVKAFAGSEFLGLHIWCRKNEAGPSEKAVYKTYGKVEEFSAEDDINAALAKVDHWEALRPA
jgi:hypothetical protein